MPFLYLAVTYFFPKLLYYFLDGKTEAHREIRSIRKNEQEYRTERKVPSPLKREGCKPNNNNKKEFWSPGKSHQTSSTNCVFLAARTEPGGWQMSACGSTVSSPPCHCPVTLILNRSLWLSSSRPHGLAVTSLACPLHLLSRWLLCLIPSLFLVTGPFSAWNPIPSGLTCQVYNF